MRTTKIQATVKIKQLAFPWTDFHKIGYLFFFSWIGQETSNLIKI